MINQQDIISREEVVQELPITDKDKENFLKAVLSDTQFSDTIELFGGKHKLQFNALTIEQNEEILNQVKLDQKSGLAENTDSYFIKLAAYRLVVSLATVDGNPFLSEVSRATFKVDETQPDLTYIKARTDLINKWQAFKLSAYFSAFNQFENKIIRLGKEIQDANFWKASV